MDRDHLGSSTLSGVPVCTVTVSSDGQLPSTGFEASLLLPVLVGGVLLLIMGAVLATRRRPLGRGMGGAAGVAALVILVVGVGVGQAAPASATSAPASGRQECELIDITDIERPPSTTVQNLLPDDQVEALAVTVRNRAAFPVELIFTTNAPSDAAAGAFTVLVASEGSPLTIGRLGSDTPTATLTVRPGADVPVTVSTGLTADATNTLQGRQIGFNLTVTATGP